MNQNQSNILNRICNKILLISKTKFNYLDPNNQNITINKGDFQKNKLSNRIIQIKAKILKLIRTKQFTESKICK